MTRLVSPEAVKKDRRNVIEMGDHEKLMLAKIVT